MEGQVMVKKAQYARFFWPTLRGITLILASCGFIASYSGLLHGENWGLPVFVVGTIALVAMTAKPDAIEDEGTEKFAQRRVPWSLIAYGIITGVGFNWVCVFRAFSRQYAFFSVPVVGATGLIMVVYAAIGLLVVRLAGGNWRTALVVFAVAPGVLGGFVLRLHLFPLR
jgi:hypothetical protein